MGRKTNTHPMPSPTMVTVTWHWQKKSELPLHTMGEILSKCSQCLSYGHSYPRVIMTCVEHILARNPSSTVVLQCVCVCETIEVSAQIPAEHHQNNTTTLFKCQLELMVTKFNALGLSLGTRMQSYNQFSELTRVVKDNHSEMSFPDICHSVQLVCSVLHP